MVVAHGGALPEARKKGGDEGLQQAERRRAPAVKRRARSTRSLSRAAQRRGEEAEIPRLALAVCPDPPRVAAGHLDAGVALLIGHQNRLPTQPLAASRAEEL